MAHSMNESNWEYNQIEAKKYREKSIELQTAQISQLMRTCSFR
jgi:hypothetical protein